MENMFSLLIERIGSISRDRATDTSQCYESDEEAGVEEVSDESDAEWQAPQMDCNEEAEEANLDDLDFKPSVKEADPIIPEPDPGVMAEGIECQRLGSNKWSRIRFKDAEKKLQAAPVFSALAVNTELASLNRNPYPLLTKQDGILGTICHGILLQWRALVDDLKKLAKVYPAAKKDIRKMLKDSTFLSVSDDLLQFTCGHRAEAIEMRRKVFKTKHEALTVALQQIPPSSTHLYEEKSLASFLKDNGGIGQLFPSRQGGFIDKKYTHFRKPSSALTTQKSKGPTNRPVRPKNANASRNQPQRERGYFQSSSRPGTSGSRGKPEKQLYRAKKY